jgi:hypothetical protein
MLQEKYGNPGCNYYFHRFSSKIFGILLEYQCYGSFFYICKPAVFFRAGSGLNIEGSGWARGLYLGSGSCGLNKIYKNMSGLSQAQAWALLNE